MAFANGAGDIISALSAGSNPDSMYISVGGLFGACIFGGTVVLAYCIYKSEEEIVMPKGEWIRDLSFYLFASLIILLFGYIGEIYFWMSICYLLVYVVYFTIVVVV